MKKFAPILFVVAAAVLLVIYLRPFPPDVWTNTIYAPNYSEAVFVKIGRGTSVTNVVVALGEPLLKATNQLRGATYWYSNRKAGGMAKSWRIRVITFSNDVVVDKVTGLTSMPAIHMRRPQ